MGYKQDFCDIFSANVHRAGAQELIEWLEKTDFFIAPASTRYHCACDQGLVMHSLNVYHLLKKFCEDRSDGETDESIAICGLLHDVCKANFYSIATRNVKNEKGQWEQRPYYTVEDQFPYGHGEKSVWLIERFLRLTPSEAMAIRWHMGVFDDSVKSGGFAISHAFEKYPIAVKLHLADLEATYLIEKETSEANI